MIQHNGAYIACSKSTYHRFLRNEHYNWRRFITLLAARVTVFFDTLTSHSCFKALVFDNSIIVPNHSKAVELLAFKFDHVSGKSVRGVSLLMLGWTDGFTLPRLPLACFRQQNRRDVLRKQTLRLTNAQTVTKPEYPRPCISRT